MMRWMRGQVAKVIFGVLLVAFLAWVVLELGMQGRFSTGAGAAAVVDGERISTQEFWFVYNQDLDSTWQALRSTMTDEDERRLRRRTLDRLVDQTLIWLEARRLDQAPSEEEVQTAIRTLPPFLNEQRQFDPLRYQAALNRLGIPPALFERQQERAMAAARLQVFHRDAVRVTDLELWLEYLRWHRRMKAQMIRFPLDEAKRRQTVDSEDIEAYWNQNRGEFEKDERVRIRHIVVAANPQGGPEAAAQARAKMETIVAELNGGANFAEVARRRSDDANTASRGGDLGWRVRGELIPEYDERVFKLKRGGLTEVFQTQFGFHLIYCEDRQAEQRPSFDDVKGRIRERIRTARARNELATVVTRAAWLAERETDIKKVAEQIGHDVVTTGWLERGKPPPSGISRDTMDKLTIELAGLEVGELTGVIETDQGFFLAQLTDEKFRRASEEGFLEERSEIEPVLLARKQRAVYETWIGGLRESAVIKIYLEGL